MPGQPDWEPLPVEAPVPAPLSASRSAALAVERELQKR
jgi:hypothetical protein